jgi:hypothetical protein
MRALIALAVVVLCVGGVSAQHCAAPVVQQVQQVYAAPQAVVVAPVVQLQAYVVPSAPLVQVYQPAAIVQHAVVQQVQVQKVVQAVQVQKVVQQKQVIRQRTVIR